MISRRGHSLMKKNIIDKICLLTVLALLCAFTVPAALPAAASASTSGSESIFSIRFEKSTDADSITLTAVLTGGDPDKGADALFAALRYDTSLLSITEEDISVLSGGMGFRTAVDPEKGIASVESAYFDQAPQAGTELVSFRFTLKSGTDSGKLTTGDISLCNDNDYLAELSINYSGSGGFLLSDGINMYTEQSGKTVVTFDLPSPPEPEADSHHGGCSSSRDAAAACLCVTAFAAVLVAFRRRV